MDGCDHADEAKKGRSKTMSTMIFRSDTSSPIGGIVKTMAADYGFEWMPLPSYPLPSDASVVLVARSDEDRVFDSLSEKCGVWNSETQTACACYELGLGNPLSPQEDEGESLTDWMLTERYYYGRVEICFESSPDINDAELCIFRPVLEDAMKEMRRCENEDRAGHGG